MADYRIGEIRTEVEVTDPDALLNPRILARIVAAVEAAQAERAARDDARRAETRIGQAR